MNTKNPSYNCSRSPTGAHHWRLSAPSGQPTVSGVCKYCFEERDFRLAFESDGKVTPIGAAKLRHSLRVQHTPRELGKERRTGRI